MPAPIWGSLSRFSPLTVADNPPSVSLNRPPARRKAGGFALVGAAGQKMTTIPMFRLVNDSY
jgi:hypothetical protein